MKRTLVTLYLLRLIMIAHLLIRCLVSLFFAVGFHSYCYCITIACKWEPVRWIVVYLSLWESVCVCACVHESERLSWHCFLGSLFGVCVCVHVCECLIVVFCCFTLSLSLCPLLTLPSTVIVFSYQQNVELHLSFRRPFLQHSFIYFFNCLYSFFYFTITTATTTPKIPERKKKIIHLHHL